jgi:hypothetical protein
MEWQTGVKAHDNPSALGTVFTVMMVKRFMPCWRPSLDVCSSK